jgi:hypothetical protein
VGWLVSARVVLGNLHLGPTEIGLPGELRDHRLKVFSAVERIWVRGGEAREKIRGGFFGAAVITKLQERFDGGVFWQVLAGQEMKTILIALGLV